MSAEIAGDGPGRFADLLLPPPLLEALEAVGYETPSPIQARTIPPLLDGRDVLGQAQTGTGKTAAFALPLLARIDAAARRPQALVLTPTRELAIQVAEAFQKYASRLPGFHVLPIYGGQPYGPQLKALARGAQVVVGTPGRVVDHIKRGTLKLDALAHLVLDEADEMLRMGFIEDVEWVLQQTPPTRQIALFSATMPPAIRRVAQTHLRNPVEVTIRSKTTTGANIRQRYWLVHGAQKLDALTRFLETEDFEALLVFARTKAATVELAEKLEARGLSAAALNGDLEQSARERIVTRLRDGRLDIVVATDVAARGLDVERVSHVINYDTPTDTESYVHRIGRTGRAGRSGEAVLFVTPRERHLLKAIERATRQPIEAIAPPSDDAVNRRRIERFTRGLADLLTQAADDPTLRQQLDVLRTVLGDYEMASGIPIADLAAALAVQAQGGKPLLPPSARPAPAAVAAPTTDVQRTTPERARAPRERPAARREAPAATPQPPSTPATPATPVSPPPAEAARAPRAARPKPEREPLPAEAPEMETYRVEVGSQHGVQPSNLVGAIANEAELDARYIGRIEIFEDHSLVDLPTGMPKVIQRDLRKTWVCGRQLQISPMKPPGTTPASASAAPAKRRPPPRRER
jgi:ATP-dependent RNA helicase CsdA (EC 5.99.1.-)